MREVVKDSIRIILRIIEHWDMNWSEVPQDHTKWRALIFVELNLWLLLPELFKYQ
jgi:hypothetical protein